MGKEEEKPQTIEGRFVCDSGASFLLKFLALNLKGDDTLAFQDILGRITELEKDRPAASQFYVRRVLPELSLKRDLSYLEGLRLIRAKDEAKPLTEAEFTLSDLGRYFAALFMTPDALKPVPEAERQSSEDLHS